MKRERLLEVLKEMLKNSRFSDREMARRIGVSQPTITRARNELEKQEYVKSYTVIPDFSKMGYQILAFTFIKMRSYPSVEEAQKIVKVASEWVGKHHNVIFTADGEGLGGKDIIMISLHKDYPRYSDFIRSYALEWGQVVSDFESFLVSLGAGYKFKPLDLKYLAFDA